MHKAFDLLQADFGRGTVVRGHQRAQCAGKGERFLRGGGIEQLVGEAGQKAIARAHGVGHFYAKAAVVVNLAFLIIHGAVAAEGNADFGRAAQIGQKADVLLERMVLGAERAGDFMQLVIIELHQVG